MDNTRSAIDCAAPSGGVAEQGSAPAASSNPVNPANPAILSKNTEQGGAVAEAGISKNNPVNPANPGILSQNTEQGNDFGILSKHGAMQ